MMLDVFSPYSQPEVCCVLQCLMSNTADLHPLHLAEDSKLFWPLVWFYGSVHHAILLCCGEKTVEKIFGLDLIEIPSDSICLAALDIFPSSGGEGEVNIACGNDSCPVIRRQVIIFRLELLLFGGN